MTELLSVVEIAELGGWSHNYVYVWLRRHGLVAATGTGTGRHRCDLYDGAEVRAALAAARGAHA